MMASGLSSAYGMDTGNRPAPWRLTLGVTDRDAAARWLKANGTIGPLGGVWTGIKVTIRM